MGKRPTSITVIGALLLIFTLIGLVGLVMAGSNAAMAEQITKMHISLPLYLAYGTLGILINLACVYGIFKGLPWSRVLYLAWGIIGLVVGFYIAPMKASIVLGLVLLVVVCAFLWTNTANDWFQARGLMLKREPDRGARQSFE
jgi:hypothetical protein